VVFAHLVFVNFGEGGTLIISAVDFLFEVDQHFVIEFVDGEDVGFDFAHALLA
jgi:hypothetical protein